MVSENEARAALKRLINEDPTPEHSERFQAEAYGETSHRGAAILLATNLENSLKAAIVRRLQLDATRRDELFSPGGPLGEFSDKIKMARALQIIGSVTRHNLDLVMLIRNAFAHAKIPLAFDTKEINDTTLLLTFQEPAEGTRHELESATWEENTSRRRFEAVCGNISANLSRWMMTGPQGYDLRGFNIHVEEGYEVWAIQQSLP